MNVLIFLLLCMPYYHVMSQGSVSPVPTPTPTPASSPLTDSGECRFVNFSCPLGLTLTNRTFSQVDICAPILNPAVAGACRFVSMGPRQRGFICEYKSIEVLCMFWIFLLRCVLGVGYIVKQGLFNLAVVTAWSSHVRILLLVRQCKKNRGWIQPKVGCLSCSLVAFMALHDPPPNLCYSLVYPISQVWIPGLFPHKAKLHCKKRRVVLIQFGYLSFLPLLHH